ncbi:uncharacterized protein ARMOST_22315 [Armillaria ostoyae]|uniref:Uncharacterized protein n=1 Tax=Armillaria ostoyae TaxID=47428 RepID=A0A284SCI5_ARMOS|nr:uncharacterized protein ARMOST_22315 [Armillaria ostoyae]
MTKSAPIGKAMIIVILLLYIFTTIDFGFEFSSIQLMFVNNAQSIVTKYMVSINPGLSIIAGSGTACAICSVLADATMIWRCWIIWRQRWLPIVLPVLLLICMTVFKIIITYELSIASTAGNYRYFMIYSSSILATTLWCTVLIIYQIVTVVQAGGGGLRAYRHACILEMTGHHIILQYLQKLQGELPQHSSLDVDEPPGSVHSEFVDFMH